MASLSDPDSFTASRRPGTRLVGVIAEVPEPHRSRLDRMRTASGDDLGGRVVPHVTLVPPVAVDAAEWAALDDHLAATASRHTRFDLELSGMGTFRPVTPVVFARVAAGAAECTALAAELLTGPTAVELQFDYHPHVTVAHRVPEANLDRAMREYADFHARFPLRSFECFEWAENDWQLRGIYSLSANRRR